MQGLQPPSADPQGPDPSNEEALFEVGFRDMAYNALGKALPALMENVATFRVLQKDVQEGEALGAFIVRYDDEILFVPAVLVDNNVKPLDVMYVRSMDRYYPLTEQFLRFVSNRQTNRMGRAVKPPTDLPTDVDLRNMVVPPSTGRYSFASADHVPEADLVRSNLTRELPARPDFVSIAQNLGSAQKTDLVNTLSRNVKIAQLVCDHYGLSRVKVALAVPPTNEKVASREIPMKRDVVLLTASMPLQEMKRELAPDELAYAFSETRKHGFHIVDRRTKHAELDVRTENEVRLTRPTAPGLYRVFMADGRTRSAAIFPQQTSPHREPDALQSNYRRPSRFLVLFPNQEYAVLPEILAEDLGATAEEFVAFLREHSQNSPTKKGSGVFVTWHRMHFEAFGPGRVADIVSSKQSTSFEYDYCHRVLQFPRPIGRLMKAPGHDAVLMGNEWYFWPLKDEPYYGDRDFLLTHAQILEHVRNGLEKSGACELQVARLVDGELRINGQRVDGMVNALFKLAADHGLSVRDAARVIRLSEDTRTPYRYWIKEAGPAEEQQQPPPEAGGQDPSMPGVPMAPPPQPSGFELALAERQQILSQQMQALQMEMQSLGELSMRAQMIDSGGGAMAAPQGMTGMMGLPPPMVGGMPAMAPVGMPPQGMPPQGMPPQGMPPQGMPPQGMPPQGMPPQGMPPQGMPPQGMPPQAMGPNGQPAPPPMMTSAPTAQSLPTQLNPNFLQDAALLGDPTVFDAAAVATLASPRALREIAQSYLPTLDAAVDKLGRTLLLLYTQTRPLRDRVGHENARQFEQRVHDVFHSLGEVVLMFSQSSHSFNAQPNENTLL